jgi:hypothetical protein
VRSSVSKWTIDAIRWTNDKKFRHCNDGAIGPYPIKKEYAGKQITGI